MRLPRPRPRCLKKEDLTTRFGAIKRPRDRAHFLLMQRSGWRGEEVAKLGLAALDLTRGRVLMYHGKGGKDRVVYVSPDTHRALVEYLQLRPRAKPKKPKQVLVVYVKFCKSVWEYRFFSFPELLN